MTGQSHGHTCVLQFTKNYATKEQKTRIGQDKAIAFMVAGNMKLVGCTTQDKMRKRQDDKTRQD